jgi:uncharacterized membrane protein YoaK (UPF0700 family)
VTRQPVRPGPTTASRSRRLTPSMVRDLLLVGLAFSSGAVDAISYLALGKIFTAFMTGNVVFLGLGLGGAGGQSVLRVAVSLAAFAAGVFLATKLVKPSLGAGLWPRRVSSTLGVAALAQAAFLAAWVATSGRPSTGVGHALTGLSALAMGLQSGAVLSLGLPGVFTTAATATVVDLVGELAGWPLSAHGRSRLAGVLVGLLAGATAGALLLSAARTYAPVLPLTSTILVIATARLALRAT